MERERKDIVIVGGGLAGLTAAIQLSHTCPGIEIAVLEKNSHPVPEAAFKVGESTIEFGAHYLQRVIGMESHLRERQLPKMGLRFFLARQDPAEGIAARVELGIRQMATAPTWQIDRGRLENALAERARRLGVEFIDACRVKEVELGEDEHRVHAAVDGGNVVVPGSWVIDASGRAAILRRQLGLSEASRHVVNAAWLRTARRIEIDKWSESAAWGKRVPEGRRWLSTNHLCGRGYWVWLIPLASGGTSVGVVADPREVPFERIRRLEVLLDWLRENEPEVCAELERDRGAIQDFRIMKGCSHGATRVLSPERWCLTGEAGLFLDPLYSPGTDFIGASNTLIARLVADWRKGEAVEERTEIYDALYRGLFQLGLGTYVDQYSLLGNTELSAAKITWDILTYFSVVAPLLLSERYADLEFMTELGEAWQRFLTLALNMQRYFLAWHERAHEPRGIGLPGIGEELFDELQRNMAKPQNDPERLREYLVVNVARLESVAAQFIGRSAPLLGDRDPAGRIDPLTFELGSEWPEAPASEPTPESVVTPVRWATAEQPAAAETGSWNAWQPVNLKVGVA
jgi:flavin-dependent dehydrogenase